MTHFPMYQFQQQCKQWGVLFKSDLTQYSVMMNLEGDFMLKCVTSVIWLMIINIIMYLSLMLML